MKDSLDTELMAGEDYELEKSGIKVIGNAAIDSSITGSGLSSFMQIDLAN